MDAQTLTITTIAKGATAQLRELAEHADRETARAIYCELLRLAHKMAKKHDFKSLQKAEKVSG